MTYQIDMGKRHRLRNAHRTMCGRSRPEGSVAVLEVLPIRLSYPPTERLRREVRKHCVYCYAELYAVAGVEVVEPVEV